jgi:GPI mannosyltransferase 3
VNITGRCDGGATQPAARGQPQVTADAIAGTAVFVVAFAARLLPVFVFPGINQPDEVFQTVEQAHRLVYGTGVLPWEFAYGARSWVLPGALAGLMLLASLFGDGPSYYVPVIGFALAALGAAAPLCSFLWGRRLLGVPGGLIAGILPAVWIDNVYFGPRTLSDSVAAHVLVVGLYASTPDNPIAVSLRRAGAAGALLALAGSLRVQLMPAIGLIGLWGLFTGFRHQRLTFVGSALLVGLLYGALDGFTWSYPFEALWRNVAANLYYDVQGAFGVQPWYRYIPIVLQYWTGLGALMLLLFLIGAARVPQLSVAAVVIALTYSLIGHKAFRFIYPVILLATIVSGIGLAQLASWINEGLVNKGWTRRHAVLGTSVATLAFVVLAQLGFANGSDAYQELWIRGRDMLKASRFVGQMSGVCGIGIRDHEVWWTGGYAAFHRAAPLYWTTSTAPPDPDSTAFNTVIYDREKAFGAGGYVKRACFGDICVAQRPGACSPTPMTDTSAPPRLLGKWKPEVRR